LRPVCARALSGQSASVSYPIFGPIWFKALESFCPAHFVFEDLFVHFVSFREVFFENLRRFQVRLIFHELARFNKNRKAFPALRAFCQKLNALVVHEFDFHILAGYIGPAFAFHGESSFRSMPEFRHLIN
jgi:hypothetical protein